MATMPTFNAIPKPRRGYSCIPEQAGFTAIREEEVGEEVGEKEVAFTDCKRRVDKKAINSVEENILSLILYRRYTPLYLFCHLKKYAVV